MLLTYLLLVYTCMLYYITILCIHIILYTYYCRRIESKRADAKQTPATTNNTNTISNTTSSESEVERERVRTLSSPGVFPAFDWNRLLQVTYKDNTIQVRFMWCLCVYNCIIHTRIYMIIYYTYRKSVIYGVNDIHIP